MNAPSPTSTSHPACAYELRFESLFDEAKSYAFPCDAAGRVDMDSLSDRVRQNYLYVRAVVGREFALPSVFPRTPR